MNRQDFDILVELCEQFAELEQRTGQKAGRGVNSSSVMKRRIDVFTRKCERKELQGRNRKLKAHKLFLEIIRSMGGA